MKRAILFTVVLFTSAAFAGDIILRQAGTKIAPVSELNLAADGGLAATRSGSVGSVSCVAATTTEKGCVSTAAQGFSGHKTFAHVSAPVFDGGQFVSAAGSGANAFAVSTNGARVDFGAGASDYASSNGTTVTYAGPLSVQGTFSLRTNDFLDFGGGSDDYCYSNGTNIRCGSALYLDGTGFNLVLAAASGQNAITISTTGARVKYGPGTLDYASSDGADTVTYAGALAAGASLKAGSTLTRGSCTLDGASPSKCTATVLSGAICVCGGKGTTAATAVGVAASVTTTTLTCTAANGLTSDVSYICL